jgi:outer membrane protein OmpA-like peptidoglycan-associated protein
MLGTLIMIVFGLSASGPVVDTAIDAAIDTAVDTTIAVPAPDHGVIRMTYGAPRMQVVPGFRRLQAPVARGGAAAMTSETPATADELDPLVVDRLERLINRRFDRLEAMAGVSGRSVGAFVQYLETAQGPALLLQPEGRLDLPPDTLYLAADIPPEQVARLALPPIPTRTEIPEMPRARIAEPGAPIVIDRRALQEELFPMVRLNFEFGGSNVLDYADPTLDAIGALLEEHPDIELEIGGHTDNVGSAAFNQALSQRRAEAVRDYLLGRFEIAPDRLVARGYGLTRPLTANRTETERAVNRRVEFTVTGFADSADDPADSIDDEQLRESLREAVQQAIRESLRTRDQREVEW